jgi:hypothetical protein
MAANPNYNAQESTTTPVWAKKNPKKKSKKLSPAQKAKAKASAKKAGRPYPNLVDNMNAAKAPAKKTTSKKSPAKKKK